MKKILKTLIFKCMKLPLKIIIIFYLLYFSITFFIHYFINQNNYDIYPFILNLIDNIRNALTIFCISLFFFKFFSSLRTMYKEKLKKIEKLEDILLFLVVEWLYFIIPIFAGQLIINCFDLNMKFNLIFNYIRDVSIISSISWILCLLVFTGERYILSRFAISIKDNLKNRGLITQVQVLKKLLITVIIFITIALICTLFEPFWRFGASLLASVGVAGIAASLAGQKVLSNIVIGFQIAVTQPIRYDDVLIVEGEWGKVEEITLSYVIVALWDQRRLVLPISYFVEKPFQNWTRNSSEIIGTVFIYVDYSIPVGKVEEEVVRLCHATPLWDKRVVCVQVTNTAVNNIEIRILASSKDAPTNFDLRCLLRRKIIEYIQLNYPKCFAYNRVFLNEETGEKNNL